MLMLVIMKVQKDFLHFFFYLNDTDDESGCTEFPHFNLKVVPKTNRMLVFPPMWTYLHMVEKLLVTHQNILWEVICIMSDISKMYTFVENKEKVLASRFNKRCW